MFSIFIVEDEKLAADNLKHLLAEIDSSYEVVGVADTVKKTVEFLQQKQPDLLLMDIHLADDISFKVFEQVEVKSPIIFTTAFDQYAIQAFKHNSIDYLLKPITKEDLSNALVKYRERSAPQQEQPWQKLLEYMQQPKAEYKKRFLVSTGSKIKTISIEEVAYFFAEGRYVTLFTHSGQKFLIDQTMESLHDSLDPEHFYRINRQFIVSIKSIQQMYAWSKSRLKLVLEPASPEEVIVSIDRSSDFKKWLNR
jgi:two-component system, LytTR family, response regulator LytT